jgi:hypothetical protein
MMCQGIFATQNGEPPGSKLSVAWHNLIGKTTKFVFPESNKVGGSKWQGKSVPKSESPSLNNKFMR